MSLESTVAIIRAKGVASLESKSVYLLLAAVLSLLVLLYTIGHNAWGDLDHYYDNAGDVLNGLMPYSESKFEYPPLSLVFMLIPRILSWNLESFYFVCAIQTYIFLIIAAVVLDRMSDEIVGTRWQARLIMLCAIVFCSYFMIARNDVYPTVIALMAIRLFQKDRPVLSAGVLAIAAMTKLYPAIFLLPMLAVLAYRRDWKSIWQSIFVASAVCIAVELPFLIADPSSAFAYLSYHSDRGIQVESVAATFFLLWNKIFPGELEVVFNYGSDNLMGPGPDGLSPYMNLILGVALAILVVAMCSRFFKEYPDHDRSNALFGAMCVATLMLFILFSKVYSAQYLIWIMLLLPLTQASCFDDRRRSLILWTMLFFGFFTLESYTQYSLHLMFDMDDIVVAMFSMKNLFHIILTIEILQLCWMEIKPSHPTDERISIV